MIHVDFYRLEGNTLYFVLHILRNAEMHHYIAFSPLRKLYMIACEQFADDHSETGSSIHVFLVLILQLC